METDKNQNPQDSDKVYYDESESVENEKYTFDSEKETRKNNFMIKALVFLIILCLVVIGAGLLIKYMFDKNAAEREARQREQENAAKVENSRRGREFSFPEPVPQVREPAPLPVLPQTDEPKPIPLQNNGPTQANTGATGQKPPAPAPKPMMLGKEETELLPTTIEGYARLEKAPLTKTEQRKSAKIGDRSKVITRGSNIPCILLSQLNSNVPGQTSCVIPENVYSNNGKRLLIAKGSKAIGEYGQTLQNGDKRIGVMWQRIETTDGFVIDVDSPATDGVGTMGVGGYVENHWGERLGAALLLSLIDDSVSYAIAKETQGSAGQQVYGERTGRQSKEMASKVLDSTINIRPTLEANRGARLMIFVNKDLWFES